MHRFFFVIIAIFVCFSLPGSAQANDSIRITNGEFPPYMSEKLQYGGVASRIVTEAFALEGITVKYGWYPWKRALMYAQKGVWDGSIGWTEREDRKEFFYFSEPLFTGNVVIFHLKSMDFDWQTIEDLKDMQIGVTIGYGGYGTPFAQARKDGGISVQPAISDEINFRKLLGGRIKLFPLTLDVGYDILLNRFNQEQIAQITYHPKPLVTSSYRMMFSKAVKNNGRMVETFNKGLKRLKASGRYDLFFTESRGGMYIQK